MVKKSKFLDKIVNRFRGGAVKVESGAAARAAARGEGLNTPKSRTAESDAVVQHVPEEIVPRSKRKLSDSEDAVMKMSGSFNELSSLLRGVQVRMEDQGTRLDGMGRDLSKLPATAEAQLDVLKALVGQLEKQHTMNSKMVETFAGLPEVMKGVQESLAKTAATDERTAQTLDEFKSTMNRIHTSMGTMVENTKVQADAAATLAKDHTETVEKLEATTQEGIKSLRWAQEDQANRMAKMVGEHSRWNRAILVMMILSFAALVSILAAVLSS